MLRLDDDEYATVREAATRSGLTPSGFIAESALAAVRGQTDPPGQDREALRELIAARSQLRRYGNNVNQAVRAFHGIGQPPIWLVDAVRLTDQAVRRIDQAADRLAQAAAGPTPRPAPVGAANTSRPSPVPLDKASGGLR